MKNKIILIIIFGMLIITGICCKEQTGEAYFQHNQNPYFPINIGNIWKYTGLAIPGDTLVVQVTGYKKIADKWYAAFERRLYRKGQEKGKADAEYWTYGNDGEIIHLDNETYDRGVKVETTTRYNTESKIGEETIVKYSDPVKLIAKNDTISIYVVHFHDCLKYREGRLYKYLVKGIGVVNDGSYMLYEYKINNGKTIFLNPKLGNLVPMKFGIE
ncbi:MAG: hypothetical protein P4L45_12270 [Ignavibacteriaceae bacterium]|nr:hypothetical protein [Ignavibacteriaceae bacterium]